MTMPNRTMLLVCTVLLTACLDDKPDSEAMRIKEAQLTKLATMLESTVRYKNPPAGLDEQALLKLATEPDPQMLANFAGFKVRVLAREKHGVVLICTQDGQRRLMEDAACTVALDRHHWQEPAQPCEFSVDTRIACPAP
jgi:hypothetical protein